MISKAWHKFVKISDRWKAWAVEKCHQEQEKGLDQQKKGLQKICKKVEEEYWEKNIKVKVTKSSLACYVPDGHTQAESNAEKGWLTDKEANAVVEYTIQLA